MDEATFWNIIQRAHDASGGDMDRKCALVSRQLGEPVERRSARFRAPVRRQDEPGLRLVAVGAAYVINGGCSDDTFSIFARR